MKLGILINTDRHLDHAVGLTKAAVSRGHEVTIFIMDEGLRLLKMSELTDLSRVKGVSMSYCSLKADQAGVSREVLPEVILAASQYYNSLMIHGADRVIVL